MKILSKIMSYSGLLAFSLVLAIFLLALTTNVSVYQSADELHSLGVKTWSGLPVPYKASAPGVQVAEFDWWRMLASMFIWVTAVFAVLRMFVKHHISKHPETEIN